MALEYVGILRATSTGVIGQLRPTRKTPAQISATPITRSMVTLSSCDSDTHRKAKSSPDPAPYMLGARRLIWPLLNPGFHYAIRKVNRLRCTNVHQSTSHFDILRSNSFEVGPILTRSGFIGGKTGSLHLEHHRVSGKRDSIRSSYCTKNCNKKRGIHNENLVLCPSHGRHSFHEIRLKRQRCYDP